MYFTLRCVWWNRNENFFHQSISGIPLEIWLHFTPWWFKKYIQWRLIFKGGYFRTEMLQSGVLRCQKRKVMAVSKCTLIFLPTKGMHWVETYFVYNFHPSNFLFGVFSHLFFVNSHPFLMVLFFFPLNYSCRSQNLKESSLEQLAHFSGIIDQRCLWSSEEKTSCSISPALN